MPALSLNKPNIFNEQQEQWLGEAQAAQLEPDYELLPEKDSVELTRIGQKLLAQLPSHRDPISLQGLRIGRGQRLLYCGRTCLRQPETDYRRAQRR